MSFVNPILFALGAAFIALPIILHFLRRKRKPVAWGAMRFLIEAYKRKRRKMTLEQLILLLTRCALVLLLALLIGRPFFGSELAQSGPRELYILLDDSIASRAIEGEQTAFDRHKERAFELLDTLSPEAGDRAGLVLLSRPARAIVTPASSDLSGLRRAIDRAQPTDAAADIEGALTLIAQSIDTDDDTPAAIDIALVSNLREGVVDLQRPLPGITQGERRVSLILPTPAQEPVTNFAIAGLTPVRSVVLGERERDGQANVIIERTGDDLGRSARTAVTLRTQGSQSTTSAEVNFEEGQTSAEVVLPFTLPAGNGLSDAVSAQPVLTATIPEDANPADNTAITPLDRRGVLRVGIVASRPLVGRVGIDRFSPADWVRLALSPSETMGEIRIVDTTPTLLDAPRLGSLDAVFLVEPDEITEEGWTLLRRFVDRGGLLTIMPPDETSVQLWPDAMTDALGLDWTLAREPVDLPADLRIDTDARGSGQRLLTLLSGELDQLSSAVTFMKLLPVETPDEESHVLTLTDGSPLLVMGRPQTDSGRVSPGLVLYLAAPTSLSWTDLPTRPLMVPLMQEILRQGVGLASDQAVRIAGANAPLPTRAVTITTPEGEAAEIPIKVAGRYQMLDETGTDAGVLAIRPDIRGSRAGTLSREALAPHFASALANQESLVWLDDDGAQSATAADALGADRDTSGHDALILWLASAALALALFETLFARWAARASAASGFTEAPA